MRVDGFATEGNAHRSFAALPHWVSQARERYEEGPE